MNKNTICVFTGLRPHKLPPDTDVGLLKRRLYQEIMGSIEAGYRVFRSGVAMGPDIWAAQAVLWLRQSHPGLRLECHRPCLTQADNWPEEWREQYRCILDQANVISCAELHYTAGCMQRRNKSMVQGASRLIAVHDGTTQGGTLQTIQYAKKEGLQIITIPPKPLCK